MYAQQGGDEKYQHASNRLQVAHRATERSDSNDGIVSEVENRAAQFRRLLKNEECAPVILLDVLDGKALAA
jgi:hypothetical protein